MKTAIIAAALALVTSTADAQTSTATPTTPGYDRPSASREHQNVVYWNDSFEHYDYSMQLAADAYSVAELHEKEDKSKVEHGRNKR